MAAYLVLPQKGDWKLNQVKQALYDKGVVFGVSDSAISTCISTCRDKPYQVAWGIPPQHADCPESSPKPRVVFTFGPSHGRPPAEVDVNSDFQSLWKQIIIRGRVREGSTLAFVRNHANCSLGIAVTGEKIPYFDDKPVLRCGSNTAISKDGKRIVAIKSGIPYIVEQAPAVLSSMKINGDIGPETGDIFFPGNLKVNGNVLQGFKVSCWGSLSVQGNLYGSANCAGNISIKGGINAPGEIIESGGDVFAKYCENSTIRAFGNIYISDAVMHSILETERIFKTSQDRGRIVGGLVVAQYGVITSLIGSPMGVSTILKIGASPKLRRRHEEIIREISTIKDEIRKINYVGYHSAEETRFQLDNLRVQRMSKNFEARLKELNDMLVTVEDIIDRSRQGYLFAKRVLPGVQAFFGLNERRFDSLEEQVHIGVKPDEAN